MPTHRGLTCQPRRSSTRRSPTTTKPSGSTRNSPGPTTTAGTPVRKEPLRQGDRRLQRGHPARPKRRHGLQQSRERLVRQRTSTTRRSWSTTRPSARPKRRQGLQQSRLRLVPKEQYDQAIADCDEAIRLDPKYATGLRTTAAKLGPSRRNTTRRSPTYGGHPARPEAPWPTATGATSGMQEGIRQGDRRL